MPHPVFRTMLVGFLIVPIWSVAQAPTRPTHWTPQLTEKEIGDLEELQDETYLHFSWCIWHEGVKIYDDTFPGALRDINQVRGDCVNKQSGNQHAQDLIKAASNDQLTSMAVQSGADAFGVWHLNDHMRWVAYHEKKLTQLRNQLAAKDFAGLRQTYYAAEFQNPNARNLLAALSNGTVQALINAL